LINFRSLRKINLCITFQLELIYINSDAIRLFQLFLTILKEKRRSKAKGDERFGFDEAFSSASAGCYARCQYSTQTLTSQRNECAQPGFAQEKPTPNQRGDIDREERMADPHVGGDGTAEIACQHNRSEN